MILIDGHNLIGRTPGLSLEREEEGREALLQRIGAWASSRGDRVVLVFDGNRPGAAKERARGSLRVMYSTRDTTADDEILRLLKRAGRSEVTIVTSDGALARRARAEGARVESAEAFRSRLDRRPTEPAVEPAAPDVDVEYWLGQFKGKGGAGH